MNKWVAIFLVALGVLVILVVVGDQLSTRKGNRPEVPFNFNLAPFKSVDDTLISFSETLQIRVAGAVPKDLAYREGKLYLLTDKYLQVLSPRGQELQRIATGSNPLTVALGNTGNIFVGHENIIVAYNPEGEIIARANPINGNSLISSMVVTDSTILVADAGSKTVRIFNHQLIQTGEFQGESGASDLHGFILPGMQFDLAINGDGELWITNPGIHAIQNYTPTGRLRGYWRRASFGHEGFSGCCNPSYIAFLSNNNIVTSEKGLPRVKIHHVSGEFVTMVAAPGSFEHGTKAPAIAVDGDDNIYLLDFDKGLIRFFTNNSKNL